MLHLVWRAKAGVMADRLAEKLQPPLGEERLERQWRGIERRVERSRFSLPQGQWGLAFVGATLAVAVALFLLLRTPSTSPEAVAGGSFDNSGAGPASLRLVDGSLVQVSPSGRVEFEALGSDNVELALDRGWVELDVTHVPGRRFVVRAGELDVVVRGTHFRVEITGRDPEVVKVSVTRGKVDILEHRTGALAKQLGAGMSWTMGQRELPKAPEEAAPAPVALPEAPTPSAEPSPKGAASTAREPVEDAKKLMELADAARLRGQTREAAAALDTLRKRFRGDARAGLAALELGRLRLDTFHDAAGALEAFRDAARLSASPSVREDALARQAQALELLGDMAGCQRVRDSYLTRYPRGIHSASITKRCGGK
jgi:transmembrane sensor